MIDEIFTTTTKQHLPDIRILSVGGGCTLLHFITLYQDGFAVRKIMKILIVQRSLTRESSLSMSGYFGRRDRVVWRSDTGSILHLAG
jgi:hypothetical protein